MDIEFKLVDKSLREMKPLRSGSRIDHPLIKALLDDGTAFVETDNNKQLAKFYETARKLDRTLHMQKGVDKDTGKQGFFLWFDEPKTSVTNA